VNSVFSIERGVGTPLLFIHGFPFHQGLWDGYGERFSEQFRFITVDLPGFGKSPLLKTPFSLDQIATTLLSFLSEKSLNNVVVVGHSLGGYVALSMVKQRRDLFRSLVLFHSTAYADSPEKKESRTKVVDLVTRKGALPFTSGFIPPLFSDRNHPAIERVRNIAGEASADAVIGYSLAMKDRQDHVKTLESFENPTLFLAGKNDPGIPPESIVKQAEHCQKPEIRILDDVAHMGMFEQPEATASEIKDFVLKTNT
jgi:pimeloyl-ACP methyl ester carboxylesterase